MRTAFMTVFLVVALQGIASASSALASTEVPSSAPVVSNAPAAAAAHPDGDPLKAQAPVEEHAERQPAPSQPQVLSKNLQSPKPVQIYWFFGGR